MVEEAIYSTTFDRQSGKVFALTTTASENDQPENLQPKYQYVWSARYIDAPVLRDRNTDADGLCDDERIYCLGDANFNVTCLVDTDGDAVERYLYDPYGNLTIYDGGWCNTRWNSSHSITQLYTGRELDSECRFYHYRNRYYSSDIGRFIGRDRIGNQTNLYYYVDNGPTNASDPDGQIRWGTARLSTPPFGWEVQTDAGNWIDVDRFPGGDYNCHSFTFGGAGKFWITPDPVPTILRDDGWKRIPCCASSAGDIIVWYDWRNTSEASHSGIIAMTALDGLTYDQDHSTVTSKRGSNPVPDTKTVEWLQRNYGGSYSCYSRSAKEGGVCCCLGYNERGKGGELPEPGAECEYFPGN